MSKKVVTVQEYMRVINKYKSNNNIPINSVKNKLPEGTEFAIVMEGKALKIVIYDKVESKDKYKNPVLLGRTLPKIKKDLEKILKGKA